MQRDRRRGDLGHVVANLVLFHARVSNLADRDRALVELGAVVAGVAAPRGFVDPHPDAPVAAAEFFLVLRDVGPSVDVRRATDGPHRGGDGDLILVGAIGVLRDVIVPRAGPAVRIIAHVRRFRLLPNGAWAG